MAVPKYGNQVTGAAVDKMVVLKVIGLIKDAPFHRCKLAIDVSWVNLIRLSSIYAHSTIKTSVLSVIELW